MGRIWGPLFFSLLPNLEAGERPRTGSLCHYVPASTKGPPLRSVPYIGGKALERFCCEGRGEGKWLWLFRLGFELK